jgi:hypothetical protein
MSIQKQFLIRYQNDGHVRFQIPSSVCDAATAKQLTDEIAGIGGVYAVRLYRRQQKLSIRYSQTTLDFKVLASHLFQILGEMERQGRFEAKSLSLTTKKPLLDRLKQSRLSRWVSEKYQAGKETVQAAKLLGKLGTQGPKALIKDPEKAAIDFLNDVLVLYLIKSHWTRITQEWLVKPFLYRYEWLAAFYMFFLLVRSRRKKT